MNILIVTQYFYPERFGINELALDLSRAGHTVKVLTGLPNYPSGSISNDYRRVWPMRQAYEDVEIFRVPIVARGSSSAWRLAINYLSFAISASLFAPWVLRQVPVDAILVYQPSPITVGVPAAVAKWLKKAPILFWVQDLWPESLVATGAVRNSWVLWLVRRLVRFVYRRSDIVLVQSRGFVDKIREVAPDIRDIRFFPNAADRYFLPMVPPADAPERSILPSGFRVVFAGNMGAAQDLGNIIDAAEHLKHLPEIQWVLIGGGRLRSWVEKQIQARGLSSTVRVLGPFPPEQMPAYFALADVLLATLRREPIFALTVPSKIQAYLASGRPILVAMEGEGARTIEEAQAGVACPPGDPVKLADAVEGLYHTSAVARDRMGQFARRYFEQEFDRDTLVKKLESWLAEARGHG